VLRDPVRKLFANGKALRLARLGSANGGGHTLPLVGLIYREPAIPVVGCSEGARFAGAKAEPTQREENSALVTWDRPKNSVLVFDREDSRLVLLCAGEGNRGHLADFSPSL
jgi:hypothetical protein